MDIATISLQTDTLGHITLNSSKSLYNAKNSGNHTLIALIYCLIFARKSPPAVLRASKYPSGRIKSTLNLRLSILANRSVCLWCF